MRRQANEDAQKLAKTAPLLASFQVLVNILDNIEHILINEIQQILFLSKKKKSDRVVIHTHSHDSYGDKIKRVIK